MNRHAPVQVIDITNVIAIAAGTSHTTALRENGTVWGWGSNVAGQLGDGTTIDRHTPVQVPNLSNVIDIGAGQLHTIALRNDGTVRAWGHNLFGQLGDDTNTDQSSAIQVLGSDGQGFLNLKRWGILPITDVAIDVIAPVIGEPQSPTAIGVGNFTRGAVTWSPDDAPFGVNTRYTATVTLTANSGYTFKGLETATINGNSAIVMENTGDTVTLSFEFPITVTDELSVIPVALVNVTAPISGAIPNITAAGTGSFTPDAVAWSPNHTAFVMGARYTASVTLMANQGHTFDGLIVATINGNPAVVTNNSDGTVTLSFEFLPTVARDVSVIPIAAVNVIPPMDGATPDPTATGSGNFTLGTVSWSPSTSSFSGNARYTATVTLTANDGYIFEGLTTGTINGNTATISNNIGSMITLSFEFPVTQVI